MPYTVAEEENTSASHPCFFITRHSIIHAENVHHLLFEDLTIKGTRSDAIVMTGNDNVVRRMKIYGVLGNAIMIEGLRNLVTECDISHVGKGGIWLTGGDRNTLTPGQNVADNNLIHDWAEVYLTYFGGVHLYGVGNVCSHNEMYNTPHTAIFYYGNDHLIEKQARTHDQIEVSIGKRIKRSGIEYSFHHFSC